jgi:phospholipid/cholesterol/gamma-HCH transport system substrate-binding protein
MEQTDFIKKFIAGLFFILCLGGIAVVVFVIGVEKGLTQPKFEMTIVFTKVGGLVAGAPVRLSGVTVGTVRDIGFLDKELAGRDVEVKLNVYSKYQKQLFKSVKFAIITEGVLGAKFVEITTSPGFRRTDLSRPVIGVDPLDVQNLTETFGDAAGSLLETSRSINEMIREIKDVSGSMRRLMNRLEQRVIEGNLFKVF